MTFYSQETYAHMGYMEKLEKQREETRKTNILYEATQNRPLAARIAQWWDNLLPEQRQAEYSIDQLKMIFGEGTNRIGPALHSLGWTRKRKWGRNGPHSRVWVPKKN